MFLSTTFAVLNTARTPMNRRSPKGWHKEDIKAAIRKRGTTLTQLAIDSGLYRSAIRVALIVPTYRAEQAVARFLGVAAEEIWPDRYDADGTPRHPRAPRADRIPRRTGRHGQKRRAA